MAFYVLDENHNLIEAYDKEGVLSALQQAIADGSLSGITADSGFISKLKCCVNGVTNSVAFITQAKYNELVANKQLKENCYYFITDDSSFDEVEEMVVSLNNAVVDCYEYIDAEIDKIEARVNKEIGEISIQPDYSTTIELKTGGTYSFCIDGRTYILNVDLFYKGNMFSTLAPISGGYRYILYSPSDNGILLEEVKNGVTTEVSGFGTYCEL